MLTQCTSVPKKSLDDACSWSHAGWFRFTRLRDKRLQYYSWQINLWNLALFLAGTGRSCRTVPLRSYAEYRYCRPPTNPENSDCRWSRTLVIVLSQISFESRKLKTSPPFVYWNRGLGSKLVRVDGIVRWGSRVSMEGKSHVYCDEQRSSRLENL